MCDSALIFIAKDSAQTDSAKPMFLMRMMGTPLLSWLACALAQRGITRYFLVCPEQYCGEAALCFPEGCTVSLCQEGQAADCLHIFASGTEDASMLVITGPCICLPGHVGAPSPACCIQTQALLTALDEPSFSFGRFLQDNGCACTQTDGLCGIADSAELPTLAKELMQHHLTRYLAQGVEIWDLCSCYVDPGVVIGAGTVLLPGTIIRGSTKIGHDCRIGPNAVIENSDLGSGCQVNAAQLSACVLGADCTVEPGSVLRHGCRLGARVRIGAGCVLSDTVLGDATHVGALSVLREVRTGRSCKLSPGCMLSPGLPNHVGPITLEDDVILGTGANIADALTMGRSSAAGAGALLSEPVPPQALAASRSKPALRKDWALHHR